MHIVVSIGLLMFCTHIGILFILLAVKKNYVPDKSSSARALHLADAIYYYNNDIII